MLAPVGRASRCLGSTLRVRPEWRCGVSFRIVKVLDKCGEKVPGEARWQTTRLLMCTRVFAQ